MAWLTIYSILSKHDRHRSGIYNIVKLIRIQPVFLAQSLIIDSTMRDVAVDYVEVFGQHWYKSKGAAKWILSEGKKYFTYTTLQIDFLIHQEDRNLDERFGHLADLTRQDLLIPDILKSCHTCMRSEDVALRKCGRCNSVRHCSKECQTKDWKQHRNQCSKFNMERVD